MDGERMDGLTVSNCCNQGDYTHSQVSERSGAFCQSSTRVGVYGDIVTDEMTVASEKVTRLALNGTGSIAKG